VLIHIIIIIIIIIIVIIIIIIMDARLTIFELCAPFYRMLHSQYIIAVHLSQLAVNFMGQGWGGGGGDTHSPKKTISEYELCGTEFPMSLLLYINLSCD
jgi:hypothetical protein